MQLRKVLGLELIDLESDLEEQISTKIVPRLSWADDLNNEVIKHADWVILLHIKILYLGLDGGLLKGS